ncbi:DEAD/DEAH box helicase [Sphingomonas koreensis]|nr:DEAD/DEAH box helicase [Sphingomonas koreensis]
MVNSVRPANDPDRLAGFIVEECERRLRAYEAQPRDVREHFETEIEVLSGGYAWRQLFELVQNAADAIGEAGDTVGRIHISLESDRIVAANTGAPLDEGGIVALLNARSSSKRAGQIGRFGIGFKSLLKLGGVVELISRTVGLRFDPHWCRQTIRERLCLPSEASAPGMRLAQPVQPLAGSSPLVTGARYAWATTVVSAGIADPAVRERLVAEMAGFPAEFLLFLEADVELVLDVANGPLRIITRRSENEVLIVGDEHTETRWRMFQRRVVIDDDLARADAMHLQARDEVPLAWAVPLGGREAAGTFWAFFPTQSQTLAAGILNAPWKLNSDRTNVIQGAWNEALMKEAAMLIADNIGDLATPEDPGAPVAALPRQLERQDELAASLVRPLWDLLVDRPIVADGDAALRLSRELARHPVEDGELLRRWRELAGNERGRSLVHPSCQTGRRRAARLDALARETVARAPQGRRIALPVFGEAPWLERAASLTPEKARALLALIADASARRLIGRQDLRSAAIIPTVAGALASANAVIIASPDRAPAGLAPVAASVADDEQSRSTLTDVLGVREMADDLWTDVLADAFALAKASGGDHWLPFWANLAEAPPEAVTRLLERANVRDLRFRSLTGQFMPRDELVVPEPPEASAVDDAETLDTGFHASHADRLPSWLLARLPQPGCQVVGAWTGAAGGLVEEYFNQLRSRGWPLMRGSPQWGKTGVVQSQTVEMPNGWKLLASMPPGLAADLSIQCIDAVRRSPWGQLSLAGGGSSVFRQVVFGHLTRRESYQEFTALHPMLKLLSTHGRVRVGGEVLLLAAIPAEAAAALEAAGFPAATAISTYLASVSAPVDLSVLAMPEQSPADIAAVWSAVLVELAGVTSDFRLLRPAWEAAAAAGCTPVLVPTTEGPIGMSEVFVSVEGSIQTDLDDGRIVPLSRAAAELWAAAGARLLSEHTESSYDDALGVPAPLAGLFPETAPLFGADETPPALWVFGLAERSGHVTREPAVAQDATGVILIDRERMAALGWAGGMRTLLDALHVYGLLPGGTAAALALMMQARSAEARALVRSEPTLEARVLRAVGGDAAAITAVLPSPAARALGGDADPLTVARLAIAALGPSLLSQLQGALDANGLRPPERWGGERARNFVTEIGFPPEYGGSANVRRHPEIVVTGPTLLPELHDYQVTILQSLGKLLSSGSGRRRAVVSLPTGGGKTRVAAEAVVRLVLNGDQEASALWVAQTDELCEQAVQCFRQLWSNIGRTGADLRVARLWAGQPDPRPPAAGEAVVVVASIQTLNARFDVRGLEWLSRPGVVVIDECHHAIAPSYSSLLRWLDVQIGSEGSREREPAVLGLSATPWRGRDEEESARLAARFDRRWLPADQAGLHGELRRSGVLAEMRYSAIRYDRPVELSAADVRHFDQYGELPKDVIERIGADPERNDLILDHVLSSSASSILLFANSVAHAQYLAARLHLAGCPAAAVSGESDRLARKHFIQRFRDGELRVLCNHSVLTTGFDAPRADMVLISRPVFSAVSYMQMVGRGLRGPANGGTEHCEIATVEDNILTYRDQLAYHYCQQFFDAGRSRQ